MIFVCVVGVVCWAVTTYTMGHPTSIHRPVNHTVHVWAAKVYPDWLCYEEVRKTRGRHFLHTSYPDEAEEKQVNTDLLESRRTWYKRIHGYKSSTLFVKITQRLSWRRQGETLKSFNKLILKWSVQIIMHYGDILTIRRWAVPNSTKTFRFCYTVSVNKYSRNSREKLKSAPDLGIS